MAAVFGAFQGVMGIVKRQNMFSEITSKLFHVIDDDDKYGIDSLSLVEQLENA